jgi:hypothetical protein
LQKLFHHFCYHKQNEIYNSIFCNMQKAPKSCISLQTSIIPMPLLSLPPLYFARPVCQYYSWSEIESYKCRITRNEAEDTIAHCGWQKRTHNHGNTTQLNLLTPLCRVLPEQLTGLQQVKKFPAFHGTRRFITALTSVRQLSLSWASPIQSIYPHPTSWRSILILSTHLRLGLPSGLFPPGIPTKTLYTPLSSPIRAKQRKVDGISIANCLQS